MLRHIILFALLTYSAHSYAEEATAIAVIVADNAEVSAIENITAQELSLVYWRKKLYWQGGIRIHPVNLHAEDSLRLRFSKVVLGNLPAEQVTYWNGLYFHGTTPPYSVQSEEAVLRYVTNTKGSIGYIDACKLDHRVKPLLWIVNEKISTTPPKTLNCNHD
ncbi:MAG: hypothetical protein HOP21_11890 [Methylotenera sp.]|nr:hypothetical protein [Methylotenera sp.]